MKGIISWLFLLDKKYNLTHPHYHQFKMVSSLIFGDFQLFVRKVYISFKRYKA
ncbi:hypothetical protein SAMN04487911_10655 [Arenibacter nanhaiticus]|uniref:Uncharacterized protein n=1 Tax=Arenibacter nanhaiticus TaxID=558155 RepID=A0A1M6E7Q6_9FLAO|nr:hypothetical protein SAMN04487911_10655 [Arenibacter nanhaiticus]